MAGDEEGPERVPVARCFEGFLIQRVSDGKIYMPTFGETEEEVVRVHKASRWGDEARVAPVRIDVFVEGETMALDPEVADPADGG